MGAINLFKSARDAIVVQPGDVIFRQGDKGDVMFAVIEGAVDVMLGDTVIEKVEPGGILGELALVDDSPRSATAVGRVESRLARVNQDEFLFLVQEHPTFALQVMRVLAERIRKANEYR